MNKFRRFLDKILAETCLIMNYFGSKSQKIAKRSRLFYLQRQGASPPDPDQFSLND